MAKRHPDCYLYGKCPNIWDTFFHAFLAFFFFFLPFMCLFHKIFGGMANSVDPDQTAPLGTVSRSALFAHTLLLEMLV